jgi:hypothetical protein
MQLVISPTAIQILVSDLVSRTPHLLTRTCGVCWRAMTSILQCSTSGKEAPFVDSDGLLLVTLQLKYGVDESYTLDVPKNGDPAIIKVRTKGTSKIADQ